jgi:transcriptional regulator with PAS, ATPase and Fis domain
MIPIFDESGSLECFVELLKAVPLASGSVEEKQIVGQSRSFIKMLEKVTRVAESNASVLLLGESGTGKELISQLIHKASSRAQKKLVALECSGLSEQLIESELFGHRKGAFTGAYNDRPGLVEEANGGTLFLDEIGDVSLATQVKLLRLIEARTFRRVGDTQVRTSDFRLICATHKDLKKMVADKLFRLDLYHRINVFPIIIPSLSERKEDIPALAEHLLGQVDRRLHITEAAIERLRNLSFQGNIRELRNLLTRASILSDTNVIDEKQIREALQLDCEEQFSDINSTTSDPLRDNELAYIETLLKKHAGNKKKVAEELGISIRTLYRKLEAE